MFICQNSEGVHAYLLKCCRGTCSIVGMLKGTWQANPWSTKSNIRKRKYDTN